MDEYIRKAKVINVVDGDTIDAIVDLGYHVNITERFRLLRVDTPEIRSKDYVKAIEAKDYVVKKVLNKEVFIKSKKSDGFGRWLGEVFYKDEIGNILCLNDELLELGLALEFTA